MNSAGVSDINSKYCVYGCNTLIYWDPLNSKYLETTTKKKHLCPNRSFNSNKPEAIASNNTTTTSKSNFYNNYSGKSNYNYKKSWPNSKNDKRPMDNSLEILHGSSETIVKQYEVLSDLIKEFNGKTHGSQSHALPNNSLQIVVYYEVPEGKRDEIKRMFEAYIRNEMGIYHQ